MSDQSMSPPLQQKLELAQRNLRYIGYLAVVGGVFALVLTLLMATRMGIAFLNVTYISFLTGGAVAFALGVGLLHFSEAARAVGRVWFLTWGILEAVLGVVALVHTHDATIGAFCLVGGVLQVLFAVMLQAPEQVFLTGYCEGLITPQAVEGGLAKAVSDGSPRITKFIADHTAPPATG